MDDETREFLSGIVLRLEAMDLKGPQGARGIQGVQGVQGPPFPCPLVGCEHRIVRIETLVENLVKTTDQRHGDFLKSQETQDTDIRGAKKFMWFGMGGMATLSFLSQPLFKFLFHM